MSPVQAGILDRMTAFSLYLYGAGLCLLAGEILLAPSMILWTLAFTTFFAAVSGLMGAEQGPARHVLSGAVGGVVVGLLGWRFMLLLGESFKNYQGGWPLLLLGVMVAGWILLLAYVSSPVFMFGYHALVGVRTSPHFRLHFLVLGVSGAVVLAKSALAFLNPGYPPDGLTKFGMAAFLGYYALILFWLGSLLTPAVEVGEGSGVSLSLSPTVRYALLAGLGLVGFGMVYTILQAHFLYS